MIRYMTVAERLAFVFACIVIPIAWGVGVNWLFQRLSRGTGDSQLTESAQQNQHEDPVIEYYI